MGRVSACRDRSTSWSTSVTRSTLLLAWTVQSRTHLLETHDTAASGYPGAWYIGRTAVPSPEEASRRSAQATVGGVAVRSETGRQRHRRGDHLLRSSSGCSARSWRGAQPSIGETSRSGFRVGSQSRDGAIQRSQLDRSKQWRLCGRSRQCFGDRTAVGIVRWSLVSQNHQA